MIVKQRDASKIRIAYLENYEAPGMDIVQRQGLKQAAARLRADTTSDNACNQIDGYFAESKDWLVIHDLRIRHANRAIQINHLLISNACEFYIIDSRYIKNALVLNENGQCWVQTNQHKKTIASPLKKLNRDIRILRDIIENAKLLPRFLGISPTINIQGYILTNPAKKTQKPLSSALDTSAVIASDMLFATVWEKRQKGQNWIGRKVNNINAATLHNLTQDLLSMHSPAIPTKLMTINLSNVEHLREHEQDTSHCAQCGTPISTYVRDQCFRHMSIYRGQVFCIPCQATARK